MKKKKLPEVAFNRVGWYAIQHHDGWWVGLDEGVTCYKDNMMARVALTLLWQRDGGGALHFSIKTFTGANQISGDYTPPLSAEKALKNYERPQRTKH